MVEHDFMIDRDGVFIETIINDGYFSHTSTISLTIEELEDLLQQARIAKESGAVKTFTKR